MHEINSSGINKNLIDYAIHKNLESLLGFSMKRTNDRQDAEDLTQDIIIEIYRSYTKLKKYEGVQALEGWMWAIARHTYCRWLSRRKKNNVVYIEGIMNEDFYESSDDAVGSQLVKDEDLNLLRRQISMLSKAYRDIIVLYYLNNKTCLEISGMTRLPLSTVKWRLHQAKQTIKERMENMNICTEKAYAPGNLWIRTTGTFTEPYTYFYICDQIKSLLRQNILLSTYRKSLTVEEISEELGVPAVYLEEELSSLVNEQFIKKKASVKYQTDFIIITREIKDSIYPILEESGRSMAEYFLKELNNLEESIRKIGFIGCDKSWEELLWTLIPACLFSCYSLPASNFTPPMKPHGNSWKIIGFEGTRNDYPWSGDSNTYSYLEGKFIQNIFWTNNLTYRIGYLDTKEAEFYYKYLTGKISLKSLDEKGKEMAAQLISKGFFIKEADTVKPNIISFTEEQYNKITALINPSVKNFAENAQCELLQRVAAELKKHVPSVFTEDILFASIMLITESFGFALKYLTEKGTLKIPENLSSSVKGMYIRTKGSDKHEKL